MATQTVTLTEQVQTPLVVNFKSSREDELRKIIEQFRTALKELTSGEKLSNFDVTVLIQDKKRQLPRNEVNLSIVHNDSVPPMTNRRYNPECHTGDY